LLGSYTRKTAELQEDSLAGGEATDKMCTMGREPLDRKYEVLREGPHIYESIEYVTINQIDVLGR